MTIEELVNTHSNHLNPNDYIIWEYLSKNKKKCSKMTIEELANQCAVSKTSIIRFAKKLSLNGYSELKLYLKLEEKQAAPIHSSFLGELCHTYKTSIDELYKKNMDSTLAILYKARRVYLYGSGTVQINACEELNRMFFNAGDYFYKFDGVMNIDHLMRNVSSDDAIIIISLSGESQGVISLAKSCKLKGTKIISITKLKDNQLASLSDENIYFTNVNFNLYHCGYREFESTAMFFFVCEFLFVKYQLYKNQQEALKEGQNQINAPEI